MQRKLSRRGTAAAAFIVAAAALTGPLPGSLPVGATDPLPCVDGFSLVAATGMIVPQDVYSVSSAKAFVAGGVPLTRGRRAARIAIYRPKGWRGVSTMRLGNDSGFVALGGTPFSGLWAVGYIQTRTSLAPLAARRKSDGSWTRVRTPRPATGGATLTDVAAHKRQSAWAVGYRLNSPGVRKPYAMRWSRGKWTVRSPGLRSGERGSLAAVSTTRLAGTWVAGSVSRFGATRPYIARRRSGKWIRMSLPAVANGALAAITVSSQNEGWAAGYEVVDATIRPLLLQWDGTAWLRSSAPQFDEDTLLLDVSTDDAGVISLAGSTWNAPARRMRGFVATRRDAGWNTAIYTAMSKHSALTAADGDPSAGGWAVGRDLKTGVALQTCAGAGAASASRKRAVRRQRRLATDAALEASAGTPIHPAEAEPAPRPGSARVPKLRLMPSANVRIRDRARAVGLPSNATTYGAVVKDFDKDGRADIFLGGHSGPARLYLDRGPSFKLSTRNFGRGDRHGCAASDVDSSGKPDLYCSFGGGRGLGIKGNQLWLDPGAPNGKLAPTVGGASEPLGRGRETLFMDVDGDGRKDLVLGQQQNRVDGLPSPNRVYLRTGLASFRPLDRPGISTGIGVTALDRGDIDGDGRTDLLLIFNDPLAAGNGSGIKLYRNTLSGFKDVRARYGVSSIGERDAKLARLDGDARPDLVQLSGDRIRISLQRNGRYKKVFERRISNAVAVAVGDADGDGDNDLYVLRQKNRSSVKDVILFNRGGGRSYRAVAAPSRPRGRADDVYPIDHDKNGLTDFLVLNGRGAGKGPLQLIAFYKR